jgi:hypothetical protein
MGNALNYKTVFHLDSPYNNSGGMHYWAPSLWADVMAEDFGTRRKSVPFTKTGSGQT